MIDAEIGTTEINSEQSGDDNFTDINQTEQRFQKCLKKNKPHSASIGKKIDIYC